MNGYAVVTGAAGSLGSLIVQQLIEHDYAVRLWDIPYGIDVTDTKCMQHIALKALEWPRVDVLVNCAGVNRLARIPDLTMAEWDKHMNVNARGMLLTVQTLLPLLLNGTVCNIISNASHVPMTASLAYNASKAAAAMLTRQMARELWPTHRITVFGVSPNRLADTAMSRSVDAQVSRVRGWSPQEVRDKQRAAMAIGEETDPAAVAEFVGFLLSTKERHRYLHGAIMEYGI